MEGAGCRPRDDTLNDNVTSVVSAAGYGAVLIAPGCFHF